MKKTKQKNFLILLFIIFSIRTIKQFLEHIYVERHKHKYHRVFRYYNVTNKKQRVNCRVGIVYKKKVKNENVCLMCTKSGKQRWLWNHSINQKLIGMYEVRILKKSDGYNQHITLQPYSPLPILNKSIKLGRNNYSIKFKFVLRQSLELAHEKTYCKFTDPEEGLL